MVSPASLHVNVELYSFLIWSSRSFNKRSQIMLTCLNVKRGASFLLGESALNRAVDEEHGEFISLGWGDNDPLRDGDCEPLWLPEGNCNCFLLCILLISRPKLAAICSEITPKKMWIIGMA